MIKFNEKDLSPAMLSKNISAVYVGNAKVWPSNELSINPTSMSAAYSGGSGDISINTDDYTIITATSNQSWATVSYNVSAHKASVNVASNASTSSGREAQITITNGVNTETCLVSQKIKPAITADSASIAKSFEAQQVVMTFTVNSGISSTGDVVCTFADASSIISGASAITLSNNKITCTVNIKENQTMESRSFVLNVKWNKDASVAAACTVTQAAPSTFVISPTSFNLGYNDTANKTISITAVGVTVNASIDGSWIHQVSKSDNAYVFKVDKNTGSNRSGSITFGDGSKTETCTIAQAACPTITVTPTSFNEAYSAHTLTATVSTTVITTSDVEVSKSGECIQSAALNGNILTFELNRNNAYTEKNGTITLTDKNDSSISTVVNITQNRCAQISAATTSLTETFEAHAATVQLQKFIIDSWSDISVTKTGAAITGTPTISNGTLSIPLGKNEGDARTGSVVLTYSKDTAITLTINVTQSGPSSRSVSLSTTETMPITYTGKTFTVQVTTDNIPATSSELVFTAPSFATTSYTQSTSDTSHGTLSVTLAKNTSASQLSGNITVSSRTYGETASLAISQNFVTIAATNPTAAHNDSTATSTITVGGELAKSNVKINGSSTWASAVYNESTGIVTFTLTENTGTTSRNCTFTAVSKSDSAVSAVITLTQNAAGARSITLTPRSASVSYSATSVIVDVTTVNITAETLSFTSNGAATAYTNIGTNKGYVTLTFAKNMTEAAKTITLTATSTTYSVSQSTSIEQGFVVISATSPTVAYNDETASSTVTVGGELTKANVEVAGTSSWVTASYNEGTGIVTFALTENTGTTVRNCTFTARSKTDSTVNAVITVTQNAAGERSITLTPRSASVSYSATSVIVDVTTVNITANTLTFAANGATTAYTNTGTYSGYVTLTFAKNMTEAAKTISLTATSTTYSVSQSTSISQNFVKLTLAPTAITHDWEAGESSTTITIGGELTSLANVEFSNVPSWVTTSLTSNEIKFNMSENTGNSREFTITAYCKSDHSVSATCKVSQTKGYAISFATAQTNITSYELGSIFLGYTLTNIDLSDLAISYSDSSWISETGKTDTGLTLKASCNINLTEAARTVTITASSISHPSASATTKLVQAWGSYELTDFPSSISSEAQELTGHVVTKGDLLDYNTISLYLYPSGEISDVRSNVDTSMNPAVVHITVPQNTSTSVLTETVSVNGDREYADKFPNKSITFTQNVPAVRKITIATGGALHYSATSVTRIVTCQGVSPSNVTFPTLPSFVTAHTYTPSTSTGTLVLEMPKNLTKENLSGTIIATSVTDSLSASSTVSQNYVRLNVPDIKGAVYSGGTVETNIGVNNEIKIENVEIRLDGSEWIKGYEIITGTSTTRYTLRIELDENTTSSSRKATLTAQSSVDSDVYDVFYVIQESQVVQDVTTSPSKLSLNHKSQVVEIAITTQNIDASDISFSLPSWVSSSSYTQASLSEGTLTLGIESNISSSLAATRTGEIIAYNGNHSGITEVTQTYGDMSIWSPYVIMPFEGGVTNNIITFYGDVSGDSVVVSGSCDWVTAVYDATEKAIRFSVSGDAHEDRTYVFTAVCSSDSDLFVTCEVRQREQVGKVIYTQGDVTFRLLDYISDIAYDRNGNPLAGDFTSPGVIRIDGTPIKFGSMSRIGLLSVNLASSIETLSANAFSYNYGGSYIVFPPHLKTIGDNALSGFVEKGTKLIQWTIPSSVTSIGKNAIDPHSSSIYIPHNSVITLETGSLDSSVFEYPIYVPSGLVASYQTAYQSYADRFVSYEEKSIIYHSGGLVSPLGSAPFLDKNGNVLTYTVEENKITIHGCCAKINDGAFKGTNIKLPCIPNSVEEIGNECFSGCTYFGDNTGSTCYWDVPMSIKRIGNNAFSGVKGGGPSGTQIVYIHTSPSLTYLGSNVGVLPRLTVTVVDSFVMQNDTFPSGDIYVPYDRLEAYKGKFTTLTSRFKPF